MGRVNVHGAVGRELEAFYKAMQVAAPQCYVPPVMPSDSLRDARRRANNLYVSQALRRYAFPQQPGCRAGLTLAGSSVHVPTYQVHQAVKGRVPLLLSGLDLSLVQGQVVLLRCGQNDVVVWVVGLDDDPPRSWASAGPTGYLT
jgi:hypothetical protein